MEIIVEQTERTKYRYECKCFLNKTITTAPKYNVERHEKLCNSQETACDLYTPDMKGEEHLHFFKHQKIECENKRRWKEHLEKILTCPDGHKAKIKYVSKWEDPDDLDIYCTDSSCRYSEKTDILYMWDE